MIKLSRLFQPRNPLFWMAMVLNGLSAALAWVVHNRELDLWASLIVAGFALSNAVIGSWLVWRLLSEDPGDRKTS